MNNPKKLEEEVAAWPNNSIHPHRFGGGEFLFGEEEVGHMHVGGVVDIPCTRSIRDALAEDRLAEEHHWVPNSPGSLSVFAANTISTIPLAHAAFVPAICAEDRK